LSFAEFYSNIVLLCNQFLHYDFKRNLINQQQAQPERYGGSQMIDALGKCLFFGGFACEANNVQRRMNDVDVQSNNQLMDLGKVVIIRMAAQMFTVQKE
jgi:hypothetical protein